MRFIRLNQETKHGPISKKYSKDVSIFDTMDKVIFMLINIVPSGSGGFINKTEGLDNANNTCK